jgi:hypothetical protein
MVSGENNGNSPKAEGFRENDLCFALVLLDHPHPPLLFRLHRVAHEVVLARAGSARQTMTNHCAVLHARSSPPPSSSLTRGGGVGWYERVERERAGESVGGVRRNHQQNGDADLQQDPNDNDDVAAGGTVLSALEYREGVYEGMGRDE